jgi:lipopolysaccharide export LptBFGC system permease protein LptF
LRGFNELTLGELASRDPARLTWLMWGGAITTRRLAWEFHFRVALACAPLALGLFSLGVTTAMRRDHGRVAMGLAALTASFGYYALLFSSHQAAVYVDWVLPVVAAWTPNLVFLAIALLLSRRPLATPAQESYR